MIKQLGVLAAFISLLSFNAQAEGKFKGWFFASSDYNWRGYSFANDKDPSIQSDISYSNNGLTVGMWNGNISTAFFKGYEFDPYITYAHSIGEVEVYGTAMWYSFAQASQANSMEYTVGVNWKGLNVSYSTIDTFFSFKTSYTYVQLNYERHLVDVIWMKLHLGSSSYEDETVYGTNYTDYKLGIQYRKDNVTLEIAYNTTKDRMAAGSTVELNDGATISSIAMDF
jgi:hypothetical protein